MRVYEAVLIFRTDSDLLAGGREFVKSLFSGGCKVLKEEDMGDRLLAYQVSFYQNSGWVQFGYRFSLDYLAFLVLLLAVGGRPLGPVARGLIVFGIVVNLFGAVTFDRFGWKYYRLGPSGAASTGTRDVVIPH